MNALMMNIMMLWQQNGPLDQFSSPDLSLWYKAGFTMGGTAWGLVMMVLAFLFAKVNAEIGFTYFMIEISESLMTPHLMPLVVFVALSITELVTGTNWGMYVIALPIVIPLAQKMGVNVALAVSAVISAGVFGSHICFYSDATVITSAATGCDNFAHAKTQIPYGLLAAAITMVLYLIAGFIF